MFQRILVAVDHSGARHIALAMTARLASLTGASVRVLHIAPSDIVGDTVVGLEADSTAHEILGGAVNTVRRTGIDVDGELLDGLTSDIAEAVADAARRFGADLIVVGPHHHGRIRAWFSPRVSDTVAHVSKIAVLLAPQENDMSAGDVADTSWRPK